MLVPLLAGNLNSNLSRLQFKSLIEENNISTTPNILILLFDALSARNMSLYGYSRNTTPFIDEFAEQGIVYHSHYAGGNYTTPGTASLLTGTLGWTHRALHHLGVVKNEIIDNNIFRLQKSKYHTLSYTRNIFASLLIHQFSKFINKNIQVANLQNYSLSGNLFSQKIFYSDYISSLNGERQIQGYLTSSSSPILSLITKQLRINLRDTISNDLYEIFPRGVLTNGFGHFFTLDQTIDYLKNLITELPKPFCSYIHIWPPHDPYATHVDFVDKFNDSWTPIDKPTHFFGQDIDRDIILEDRRMYDEFVAYVDKKFFELISLISDSNLLEDTIIIFTSDHGEMFERGIQKHTTQTLYEPIIKVPLIIRLPGQPKRVDIYNPTSCIDLLPTLQHLSGEPIPSWCEGEILPPFNKEREVRERSIYVLEAKENPKQAPLTKRTVAMIKGQYKLIHYLGYKGFEDVYELYDLENDPEELFDLYGIKKGIASAMREELLIKMEEVNTPYQ
jgi:arylsulfatase A-like enzyme